MVLFVAWEGETPGYVVGSGHSGSTKVQCLVGRVSVLDGGDVPSLFGGGPDSHPRLLLLLPLYALGRNVGQWRGIKGVPGSEILVRMVKDHGTTPRRERPVTSVRLSRRPSFASLNIFPPLRRFASGVERQRERGRGRGRGWGWGEGKECQEKRV